MDIELCRSRTVEDAKIIDSLREIRVFAELFKWATDQFYFERLKNICKKVLNGENSCVYEYVQPLYTLSKRYTSEEIMHVRIDDYKVCQKFSCCVSNTEIGCITEEFDYYGISLEMLQSCTTEELAVAWFLIKNHRKVPMLLLQEFSVLKSTGFLKNPMMLNSISFLSKDDIKVLKEYTGYNGPLILLLIGFLQHPNCINYENAQEVLHRLSAKNVDWCHLIIDHQNIAFPIYKFYLFREDLDQLFMNKHFLIEFVLKDNAIIIKIDKIGEIQRLHVRTYPKLRKSFDPVNQYVDSFLQEAKIPDHFLEKEKVSSLFFAILELKSGNESWKHVFHSRSVIAVMTNYEAGDSLYDSLWRIVSDKIHADKYQPVKSLTSPIIYINAVEINLLEMLNDAKSFLEYVLQFATNLFVYFPEDL